MSEQTTDWAARHAEVVAADGDEWDRLSEAYDEAWEAEYRAEFRKVAADRGWSQESIESGWLDDMPHEALIACGRGGECPRASAAVDVIECEGYNDD